MSKNANLLQSFLTVAVGCLAAVTVASLFFNLYLFYICLAVTVVCTAALWWLLRQLKRQVNAVMMAVGQTLTGAQKEAAQTFPVPVLCCDAQGEILWGNALAERTLLGGQGPYGQSIYAILNGVNLAGACPENGYETEYQGRNYIAYPVRAVTQEPEVYLVYFFDNTKLKRYAREYFESRPSVSLILVDNYEELQQGMKDNERARVMGEIEYAITKFVSENHGVILKNERDRFTVVTEERNLRGVISSRFPLLEQVRALHQAVIADEAYIRDKETNGLIPAVPAGDYEWTRLWISYHQGGSAVDRYYSLPLTRERMAARDTYDALLDQLVNSTEMKAKRLHLDDSHYQVEGGSLYVEKTAMGYDLSDREAAAILEAVGRDMAAGNWGTYDWFAAGQGQELAVQLDLRFSGSGEDWRGTDWINVVLRPEMTETVACLQELGLISQSDLLTYRELYPENYETEAVYGAAVSTERVPEEVTYTYEVPVVGAEAG